MAIAIGVLLSMFVLQATPASAEPLPDLGVTIRANTSTAKPGDVIAYTGTVTNHGDGAITPTEQAEVQIRYYGLVPGTNGQAIYDFQRCPFTDQTVDYFIVFCPLSFFYPGNSTDLSFGAVWDEPGTHRVSLVARIFAGVDSDYSNNEASHEVVVTAPTPVETLLGQVALLVQQTLAAVASLLSGLPTG